MLKKTTITIMRRATEDEVIARLGEVLGVMRLAWPPGVPQTAFLVLGLWVGLLFDRTSVKSVGRLLPFVLASAVGLTVACAGLGCALTVSHPSTGLLPTSPLLREG